ncbi:unnamed protein product, partial [Discosporangium mesarthrocarpum]
MDSTTATESVTNRWKRRIREIDQRETLTGAPAAESALHPSGELDTRSAPTRWPTGIGVLGNDRLASVTLESGVPIRKMIQGPQEKTQQQQQRLARRLRRKRLAKAVVNHWKSFARERILALKARHHNETTILATTWTHWRARVSVLQRKRRRISAADARHRFLTESRALSLWLRATRSSHKGHRLYTAAPVEDLTLRALHVRRSLKRWELWAAYVASSRATGEACIREWARRASQRALVAWRGWLRLRLQRPRVTQGSSIILEPTRVVAMSQRLLSWRRWCGEARRRREYFALAAGFRRHVLLLRHHEAWRRAAVAAQGARAVAQGRESAALKLRQGATA